MARAKRKPAVARKGRAATHRTTRAKASAPKAREPESGAANLDRSKLPVNAGRKVQQPAHRRRRDGA